jgi:hypothetical protein
VFRVVLLAFGGFPKAFVGFFVILKISVFLIGFKKCFDRVLFYVFLLFVDVFEFLCGPPHVFVVFACKFACFLWVSKYCVFYVFLCLSLCLFVCCVVFGVV